MSFIKRELNLFLLALGFFSRIPMPAWLVYSPEALNSSSRYFTLVGWLLGVLVAGCFMLVNAFFPLNISLWLAMLFSLLLTGAFHEDGLADTADGFGGGFSVEKKLSIMKDSRLGTYGAAALLMTLAGKYLLLLEAANIPLAIVIAYALSRTLASSLIFDMDYVADIEISKSKPLANRQSPQDLFILLASSLPVFLLLHWKIALTLCAVLLLVRYVARYYFIRQIKGYTGDCLGAAQQIAELSIYAVLILFSIHVGILQ
ncbi:MAG TPA: adenosylcobinamide-GDP ribazoletransferase [Cellvibrio sp.]|nr:adenosylcobinamide-GDP ribazoletransferase [Cellvibrio sp.]